MNDSPSAQSSRTRGYAGQQSGAWITVPIRENQIIHFYYEYFGVVNSSTVYK